MLNKDLHPWSPYHPTGNSQVERYNGVIWKAIRLALKTHNLSVSSWEAVLTDALQSLRSLLNTITNHTPHELFFNFHRRSPSGKSLPAWLITSGPALLRKFVQAHKNDDLVEKVQLAEANPTYASIHFANGRESTVSAGNLSPCSHPPAAEERQPTPAESVHNYAEIIDIPAEIPAEASNKVDELPFEEDVGLDNLQRDCSPTVLPPPPPDHHEKPGHTTHTIWHCIFSLKRAECCETKCDVISALFEIAILAIYTVFGVVLVSAALCS